MTCFLMENPRAVFIHIPKTAGTSVQAMWGTRPVRRCFGHIPTDWMDAPKFSIVRDPKARFLSAVRMFKYGSTGRTGTGEKPRMPKLTIDQALDIAQDARIAFDRTQRFHKANLKHHLLPQTHPFNCLHLADHIFRQETLSRGLAALDLPGLKPLPHLRLSTDESADLQLSERQLSRLEWIFAEDYKQLGYALDGKVVSDVSLKSPTAPDIWSKWPAFFSDETIRVDRADDALPAPDVDLEPFEQDVILGVPKSTWPGRSANLVDHFQKLMPEFVGQTRLAHLAACCIVVIRRKGETGTALPLFRRIINDHTDVVLSDMSSRWLTSVSDTLADWGDSDVQKALGLCGSMLSNSVKLAETERMIYGIPRPWPPAARHGRNGTMYDGVISFWQENGDMIDNQLDRAANSLELDTLGGKVLIEITCRILQNDTFFRRMSALAGEPQVPLVSQKARERLQRIAHKWL